MNIKGKRPSHATIVAYLALFIALATGVSYAATKITSSGQIAKNVIKSKHLKDGTVLGKDVKDGAISGKDVVDASIAGADVKDGSVAGNDILDASVSGTDIAQGSIGGADVANSSITGVDLNLSQLGFGQTFSDSSFTEVAVDDGSGLGEPQADGTIASVDLPAGKYLINARTVIRATGNDGGALCDLNAGNSKLASAAAATDEGDYVLSASTFDGASVMTLADFATATTVTYECADGNTNVLASQIAIDAVQLPG